MKGREWIGIPQRLETTTPCVLAAVLRAMCQATSHLCVPTPSPAGAPATMLPMKKKFLAGA